jgi:hypothetical protein
MVSRLRFVPGLMTRPHAAHKTRKYPRFSAIRNTSLSGGSLDLPTSTISIDTKAASGPQSPAPGTLRSFMQILAKQIAGEINQSRKESRSAHCAIYERDLRRIWPLNAKDRDRLRLGQRSWRLTHQMHFVCEPAPDQRTRGKRMCSLRQMKRTRIAPSVEKMIPAG